MVEKRSEIYQKNSWRLFGSDLLFSQSTDPRQTTTGGETINGIRKVCSSPSSVFDARFKVIDIFIYVYYLHSKPKELIKIYRKTFHHFHSFCEAKKRRKNCSCRKLQLSPWVVTRKTKDVLRRKEVEETIKEIWTLSWIVEKRKSISLGRNKLTKWKAILHFL